MFRIIKYLVFTEKSTRLLEKNGQYVFDVDPSLTKSRVRFLIEKRFSVRIFTINLHCIPFKKYRGSISDGFLLVFKRVIVTLIHGEEISLYLFIDL
jgi:large subunit ribosomal protein L23